MLIRWVTNTRRIRKIQKMCNVLDRVSQETEDKYKKVSLEYISLFTHRRQIIRNYLTKYTQNFI